MYWWNTSLISIIHFIFLFALLNAYRDDCFVNEGGYICCDKQLEEMMENVMNANNNNLLNVAKRIDKNARTLRGKFETVVAFDDFAYKGLFKAGKACRVLKNGMQALT